MVTLSTSIKKNVVNQVEHGRNRLTGRKVSGRWGGCGVAGRKVRGGGGGWG